MPRPQDVARQPARQVEAVESTRLDAVMRRRCAHQHLQQEQQRHDDEVLERGPLARGGVAHRHERMDVLATAFPAEVIKLAERKQHERGSAQERHQTQRAPENRVGAQLVPGVRVVREVVGVGVGFAGPVRDRSPSRPCEERGELAQFGCVGDVFGGQAGVGSGLREVSGPLRDLLLEGEPLGFRERQGARLRVVAVLLQQIHRFRLHRVPLGGGQGAPGALVAVRGEPFLRVTGERVEVFCGEVRAEIGAVAPDRAVLH